MIARIIQANMSTGMRISTQIVTNTFLIHSPPHTPSVKESGFSKKSISCFPSGNSFSPALTDSSKISSYLPAKETEKHDTRKGTSKMSEINFFMMIN